MAITGLAMPLTGDDLVAERSEEIARSRPRRTSAAQPAGARRGLRHRLSYLADDLVVPTWNAAFVYDTDAGAQAALEIFEFANSQLLQFRYYDDLLDVELTRIYATCRAALVHDLARRAATSRAAQHLHALFIDVNELTDRTENALKMVGDVYAARLFT